LTIVLGAVDGFNPCAMWVLVFLIGLLVGMRDPVRMWSYGAAFLLTSAAVYFAFMAAWLNIVLHSRQGAITCGSSRAILTLPARSPRRAAASKSWLA
jgi:hypothetical protein